MTLPANYAEAISLEEVADFLQWDALPAAPALNNLQRIVMACASRLEQECGEIISQTFTEIYDGGDVSIFLRHVPVLSITSMQEVIGIVPYSLTEQPVGEPVDNFGFSLDSPASGRVTRRSAGSQEFPFYANTGNITVTYTAGMSPIPYNVKMALLEFIRHVWFLTQQGTRGFFGSAGNDEDFEAGAGQTPLPYAVLEWLGFDRRPPTIA